MFSLFSFFNGAYIRDNCINIGTKIEVIRSGDVIPYINSVITASEPPKMPDPETYKWNKTKIKSALKKTYDAEIEIKSNSSIRKDLLIKNLIIELCATANSA